MSHEIVDVIEQPVIVVEVAEAVGARGPKGDPGRDGLDGAPGVDGKDGADGAPGRDGLPGVDGRDGTDGLSAYEVAVAAGFVGTEVEWLASLAGPAGADGAPGRDGSDGLPGRDGVDGQDGAPGRDGVDGQPGRDGADGAPGAKGDKGDPGQAGPGLPAGGLPGQVPVKASATDYDIAWADQSGGGGWARETTAHTTTPLSSGATEVGTLPLAAAYRLLRVATDVPARVRLYTNAAKRDADLDRPIGVKPTGDNGRIFEAVTTSELPAFDCTPTVDGFVEDGTSTVPYSVTSTSPAGGDVTVTFIWIRTE